MESVRKRARELGEIETPIVLTNTLSVPRAAEAVLDWVLTFPGNEAVTTVNPVLGETNDGRLNNIRRRALGTEMFRLAIDGAAGGPFKEGSMDILDGSCGKTPRG